MSNDRRKNWFHFGWHPGEEELLLFLDGEASNRMINKVRGHLEGCWACRNQRDKLERAIATFMDYCAAEASDSSALPPRASLEFAELLRQAASTQPKASLIRRTAETLKWRFSDRRILATAMGFILLSALGLVLLRAERPVSAKELLRRTTRAEALRLSSVIEPVVYRKLLVKRSGVTDPVVLESWNDTGHKQFRRRVGDGRGARFLNSDEKDAPVIIAELEQILRANRFDSQRPLSAEAFVGWRQTINTQAETITENGGELKLTTVTASPHAIDAIAEATLTVRKRDWHPVALQLRTQSEDGLREYELSETSFEVLPAQALAIFTDSPPLTTPVGAKSPSSSTVLSLTPSSAAPIHESPSDTALRSAEVTALYALHQAQADLGEQIDVVVEGGRQVVVRGLVQTPERRDELLKLLRRIELVSPQLQTVDEATKHPQQAANGQASNEIADVARENVLVSGNTAAINPFQQKLIEHFGGQPGMSEATRQEVNRKVTQFYNVVETEASASLAEAWALRRLDDRFAGKNDDLDAALRQKLQEMQSNHLTRLRARSRNLQARLTPLLIEISGSAQAVSQSTESSRQSQIQALFHAIEQTSRLTDQLISGESAESLPQMARALLTELSRLDAILATLVKN